jgi:hypothetical protein
MKITQIIFRKVLTCMILYISLLLSAPLSAQGAFHLAGQYAYRENLSKELNLAGKMNKIIKPGYKLSLKELEAYHSNKRSGEFRNLRMENIKKSREDKPTQAVSIDTVQKLRLALLKRNFAGSSTKTNN